MMIFHAISPFMQSVLESTCLKRVTVCEIFDEQGNLLACESNQCSPPDGKCLQTEGTSCHTQHAELRAVNMLPKGSLPYRAVVHGHESVCCICEEILNQVGVQEIEIKPDTPGCGLRKGQNL